MLSYDNAVPVNGQEPASAAPVPAASSKTSSSAKTNGVAHADGHANSHAQKHHLWLVTGPAGCGKTTVAEYLADALDVPYIEGDSFHTEANVEKMRSGVPLTDADRWDWLTALRDESMRRINGGSEGAVVTCSALKRKYRDVIRVAAYYDHDILVHFIFLIAPAEVLLQRVTQRQGHYMGANMVKSQFDILERPAHDERDVISIDVSRSIDEVKQDALARVSDIVKADH
ncbi:putative gluconokinase [Tolypocladium ophioglossoides CBS 100239]|uniref:Gluconokinase n=1 Tax=Tolypocladium ophioglossoides (strain CBS 100239) TaxID=1163406 RepID=A0A0L0N5R1_TOLOC|nr:putative gluconokinase [Tolypocladium ophioglossoides CBS 100239]